ncbi:sugar ABC transporter substrate-binding protein [Prosthecobacter vanneervenii]|uniref:D-xylose transport system substrate-binding protein n=1 Tax=Prosthecobacter vanneervenii TaxID=48466 RepID=A0A7W8DIZ1_9BACT|nr:substrate-binding domain-containing protein [Prosthecobacter vanneervenii]MBB5031532.1 D-xylose transport system substrate-binding protein [Prosthecobacter vanneervenii]
MSARILLVLVSCALSVITGLVIARGGVGSTTVRQRPVIGLSMDTLKEERWQVDRDLFTEKAKAAGADVLVQSANSNDAIQLQNVESLITQKVDALVIIPHDGAAMAKAVNLAHQAGIPVLSYDRLITGCDLDLYLTFDNVKVGELQAKFLVDRIPAGGKLRVIRIYGAKTDNNAKLFKQGQDNVLQPLIAAGKLEVIFEDWAEDWKPESAKKITNAAITKNGANFDAILASNDGTAGGAIQALTEEGLTGKIIVTGQDADLAACQRIAQGTQAMTVYKPIQSIATKAAELALKLAQRKPLVAKDAISNGQFEVPAVLLDIVSVTKENLRETVVKDGFRKESDVFQSSQP